MPIAQNDTELEEFCQEFETHALDSDDDYDYRHFPMETTLDFDEYLSDKDPERILSQIIETGQISLLYDLLEHISNNAIESFSGIIFIYADRTDNGIFNVYQDVFNSRSGIADRQSCTVTNRHGRLHVD